jgi:hypothetical protein
MINNHNSENTYQMQDNNSHLDVGAIDFLIATAATKFLLTTVLTKYRCVSANSIYSKHLY